MKKLLDDTKLFYEFGNLEIRRGKYTWRVFLEGEQIGFITGLYLSDGFKYVEEGTDRPYFPSREMLARYICYRHITKEYLKKYGGLAQW